MTMSVFKVLLIVLSVISWGNIASAQDKRILVYGDSNTWGWIPRSEGFPASRLADRDRFSGVLAASLGDGYSILVNGLVGRTTDLDRPEAIGPVPTTGFNGAAQLPSVIASQGPFDLVIIMLGTNDLSAGFARSPEATASAAVRLASVARSANELVFSSYSAPKVLLVAPPPYGDTSTTPLAGLFAVGERPSRLLGAAFMQAALAEGIPVFDAKSLISKVGGIDGVHMTVEDHRTLGQALALEVKKLIR